MANSTARALSISYSPASGNGTLQFWRQSSGNTTFLQSGTADGGTNPSEHMRFGCTWFDETHHSWHACDTPPSFCCSLVVIAIVCTQTDCAVDYANAGQIVVARQGAVLYAVQNYMNGAINSYGINLVDGTAQLQNSIASSGDSPIQASTDVEEDWYLVVNYGAGTQGTASIIPIASGVTIARLVAHNC